MWIRESRSTLSWRCGLDLDIDYGGYFWICMWIYGYRILLILLDLYIDMDMDIVMDNGYEHINLVSKIRGWRWVWWVNSCLAKVKQIIRFVGSRLSFKE